jgi:NAD(P)-dependent dehydrogenase (short-subunit alcohol dehydrogenase family)
MQFDFQGKVAVVTGASRGVGRRVVTRLAAAGAKVVFGARRAEPLRVLESELRGQGHDVAGVRADVAIHGDCERLVATAGERVQEVVVATARARNLPLDEVRKSYQSWSPMNEMVTEEEIADMVLFLCSDSARHMTGQDINMSAGAVMF